MHTEGLNKLLYNQLHKTGSNAEYNSQGGGKNTVGAAITPQRGTRGEQEGISKVAGIWDCLLQTAGWKPLM